MKVKLIPEISYRVETEDGELLGVFTKASEWEGLTKLKNNTDVLIVHSPTWVENLFERDEERFTEVVASTPGVLVENKTNAAKNDLSETEATATCGKQQLETKDG